MSGSFLPALSSLLLLLFPPKKFPSSVGSPTTFSLLFPIFGRSLPGVSDIATSNERKDSPPPRKNAINGTFFAKFLVSWIIPLLSRFGFPSLFYFALALVWGRKKGGREGREKSR